MGSAEGKMLVAKLQDLAARRARLHGRKAEITSELADVDLQLASLESETSQVFKAIATGNVELHTGRRRRTPPIPTTVPKLVPDELSLKVARDLKKVHLVR